MNGDYAFEPPKKTLGAFLREKRRSEGFSIRRLVDAVRQMAGDKGDSTLSSAYLCDIENGRRTPSDGVLALLASALRISEEELELYDNRIPNQEIQELAQMNALYGVAFRRMVRHIKKNEITPEDILQVMVDKFNR